MRSFLLLLALVITTPASAQVTINGQPINNVVSTQYVQPTTGQTVTANTLVNVLLLDPAGTLATLTVVLPTTPVDGQVFMIGSSQIITALTITGTTVGTLTTLGVGGFARFCYSGASAKWFRIG